MPEKAFRNSLRFPKAPLKRLACFLFLPTFCMLCIAYRLPGQTQSLKEHIYVGGRLVATERSSSAITHFPKSGDYDGDLKADPEVFRPSTGYWYILFSGSPGGWTSKQWGVTLAEIFVFFS